MPLPRTIEFRRRPRDREKPNKFNRFYACVVTLFTSCFVGGDQDNNVISRETKKCKEKNRLSIVKRFKRSQKVAPLNDDYPQIKRSTSNTSKGGRKSPVKESNSKLFFILFYPKLIEKTMVWKLR